MDYRESLCNLLAAKTDWLALKTIKIIGVGNQLNVQLAFDRSYGKRYIAAADEAGRGCLAGPLVAGAVLIDLEAFDTRNLGELKDSKKCSQNVRERLYPEICVQALEVSVVVISSSEIDEHGIQHANLTALSRALENVAVKDCLFLVDGFALPQLPYEHTSVIKGDQKSAAIAAASIVAKVQRDRLMYELDKQFPQWGFAKHVGYPTVAHRDAIAMFGPSPVHRRSFRGVVKRSL